MNRFFDLYFNAFRNYFNFSGRACRAEAIAFIWTNYLLMYILPVLIVKYTHILQINVATRAVVFFASIIGALFAIFILIPTLALTVRRLHDINLSGWTIILFILIELFFSILLVVIYPVVRIIFNIVAFVGLFIIKGNDYTNIYGEPSSKY